MPLRLPWIVVCQEIQTWRVSGSVVLPQVVWYVTEVWHMAHFWVSYGRCTMPGSPMGRSEGSSRRWTG